MNMDLNELAIKVSNWAIIREIDKKENAPKQMIKVMEEVGETAGALLKKNEHEIKDGIGDMVVVLTNLTSLATDIRIEDCIDAPLIGFTCPNNHYTSSMALYKNRRLNNKIELRHIDDFEYY